MDDLFVAHIITDAIAYPCRGGIQTLLKIGPFIWMLCYTHTTVVYCSTLYRGFILLFVVAVVAVAVVFITIAAEINKLFAPVVP